MDQPSQNKTYRDLMSERASLDARIKEARDVEVAGAMSQVNKLIEEFGLTPEDIFPAFASALRKPVAAKYRNPETGQTWTGRGKPPVWTKGLDLTQFRVQPA